MTPLHALERELLRRCAAAQRRARIHVHPYPKGWNCYEGLACRTLAQHLTEASRLAAQYRDLRDARRLLSEIEDNVICCFCHGNWDHAPGCVLERLTRDE